MKLFQSIVLASSLAFQKAASFSCRPSTITAANFFRNRRTTPFGRRTVVADESSDSVESSSSSSSSSSSPPPEASSSFGVASSLDENGRVRRNDRSDEGYRYDDYDEEGPNVAISIVSELKASAALFAAFAYGSLNLPPTLTVSESKVTSVTTSLSISRPLPDSDFIRAFVVLDVCTLCFMIVCVASSQLLIYRLSDGSWNERRRSRDDDDDDDSYYVNGEGGARRDGGVRGRGGVLRELSTRYGNEFAAARLSFDAGLFTLLLAVLLRTVTVYDRDIVEPVAMIIGTTSAFLAVTYLTSYLEVFRRAEKTTTTTTKTTKTTKRRRDGDGVVRFASATVLATLLMLTTFFLVTLGGGGGGGGGDSSPLPSSSPTTPDLLLFPRVGPYGVTPGESKLRVVTEKIDSEKNRQQLQQQQLQQQQTKARKDAKDAIRNAAKKSSSSKPSASSDAATTSDTKKPSSSTSSSSSKSQPALSDSATTSE